MPLHQLTNPTPGDLTLQFSFKRKLAKRTAQAHAVRLNLDLVGLLAFDADDVVREQWRREATQTLEFLSNMRVRPKSALVPAPRWRGWLYAAAFGGNEDAYTLALLNLVPDQARNGLPVQQVHKRLKKFHEAACGSLSEGRSGARHLPA